MSTPRASAVVVGPQVRRDTWARRIAYVALLALAPLLPHLSSGGFDFPAVSAAWVCLPLAALLLVPLVDLRAPWRWAHLDLLVLLSPAVALVCERPGRTWAVLLVYPPLAYLAVRMLVIARGRRSAPALRLRLPRSWLVAGIAVLAAVHVGWALQGTVSTDVASGSVQGAQRIVHGRPLYGAPSGPAALDPHTDTYGPATYEAYVPLAAVADSRIAARVTTLLCDLLTALLLFALGRQVRGPTAGIVLAYCWLALPFTLYEDAFAFNDALAAAALVGTVLVARSPVRRGVLAALAGWTKFSPLALVPLLAGYAPSRERSVRRDAPRFALAFALATVLIYVPVVADSDIGTFVSRTLGFQASRTPSFSLWGSLQNDYAVHLPWLGTASRVLHGLLAALVCALIILLPRASRRQDAVGLAAASAAVLIGVQACLGYWAFSYVLWFAPLVLAAVILAAAGPTAEQARA